MPFTKEQKAEAMKSQQKASNDTGSGAVQAAILTEHIKHLTAHLQVHRKDHHSRRGLLTMVNKRNRILKYIYRTDREGYKKLVADLGIRDKFERNEG